MYRYGVTPFTPNERDAYSATSVHLLFPCCKTFQITKMSFCLCCLILVFSSQSFCFSFPQIRNMAEKVPSFQTGGALWFTDLTTPDSLYILPVITALTFLITVEVTFNTVFDNFNNCQTLANLNTSLDS